MRSNLLAQVPQVTRPHSLYGIPLGQLRKNGVYAVAKPAEEGTLFRGGVSLLGGIQGHKLYAHGSQLFSGFGRVVVAVSYGNPGGFLGECWKHGELMGVGRGYREAGDNPRPAETLTCTRKP